MPMVELRGLSALEAWSRKVTAGYKDVKVHDLSTSWRDGLAFCALIHHFRPDLIDFDSLSKENILYNNRLAFAIAEKHLGVPSLLDAEDMFKHEEPDRLSVATYLSQFYECFEGSKSDRKPSMSGTNFRKSVTNDETHTNSNMNNKRNSLTHPPIPPKRDMRCHKCKLRVYISERIIIDDNVYHKSCYDSLCIEENSNGNDQKIIDDLSLASNNDNNNSIVNKLNGNEELDINDIKLEETSDSVVDNHLEFNVSVKQTVEQKPEITIDRKVDEIDVRVSNNSINSGQSPDESNAKTSNSEEKCEKSIQINDKNSIPDSIQIDDKLLEKKSINEKSIVDEVKESLNNIQINDKSEGDEYPDDKNPFGDEEEDDEINENAIKTYPIDMNPFGDDDMDEEEVKPVQIRINNNRSDSSLNPFGEDFEQNDNNFDSSSNTTPKPKPRKMLIVSEMISPTNSLRGRKKRAAPTPPLSQRGLTQVNSSCSLDISGDNSRRDSLASNISSDLNISSQPNSRTPTPLPRLRLQKSTDDLQDFKENKSSSDQKTVNNIEVSAKSNEVGYNDNKSSNDEKIDKIIENKSDSNEAQSSSDRKSEVNVNNKSDISAESKDSESSVKNTNTFGFWKTKKRPAPPIPAVKRIIKGSIAEIEAELNGIGDQLPLIEKRSVELETIIKNRNSGEANIDQVIEEFLSTAREKCRLARRQKELMYMKREHKLEEIQADIEYQMRIVISKQSAQKTEEDEKKEEELLQRLVEIIEERNDIVENMIRDENKEVEEYQKLVSKVLPTKTIDSKSEKNLSKSAETLDKSKEHKNKEKKEKKSKKEKSEKVEKVEKALKYGELKKEAKHSFSLGKSTLKRLGVKSSSDNKLDKNEKRPEKSSSNSLSNAKNEK